tara:strand:- start:193 stop:1275 length:1083 start_codon:yes stop_codon:yes gene_type:complete
MTRYTKTMAEAYREVTEDPVAKAQDKLDATKKIAALKKQIDDIKAQQKSSAGQSEAVDSDDTGGAAEVDMIKNQVNQMRHFLDGIESMIAKDGDVEEWVQSKITKATDYLKTAYSYKTGEKNEEVNEIAPAIAGLARAAATGAGMAIANKAMNASKKMDPKQHVAKSKKNPDMYCVFDKDGNEVKLFKDKKDAEEYAIKNHDKLMENMILEFTDAQIKRLKKEYEPLRGKETGMNPEKFKKLRVMMSRMTKDMLLKLVKADLPIITSAAKARLVVHHGMKWSQLPEELVAYIDFEQLDEAKSNFKSVEPKVIDRVEKMMRGSRDEKNSIANLLNYLMPPEVVDMIRYKLKITQPRGKIKF